LNLKYGKLLLSFAFKSNLRCYTVVKHYDLPVTLRVAGGWVRDKLLGKNSADIDIALDCMLGRGLHSCALELNLSESRTSS
jgi:hypothetical protein